MRLPVPDPRELAGLLPRIVRLVEDAERLVDAVDGLVDRIESTRVAAQDVVVRADATVARADALVVLVEPSVLRLLPVLERLADAVGPARVDALLRLADLAPPLVEDARRLLPVVEELSSVPVDLGDLLTASRELNELLGGLPGMGRVKKRVEEANQDV